MATVRLQRKRSTLNNYSRMNSFLHCVYCILIHAVGKKYQFFALSRTINVVIYGYMAQAKIWFSYKKRVSPVIHFGMLDNTTLYFIEDFIKRHNVKVN